MILLTQISVPKEHTKYFSADDITVEWNSSEKDAFSILHLNVRSLSKNLETFLAELDFGFQIICPTGSWCSVDADNENINGLPGYNSAHQVRKHGQGVGFVRNIDRGWDSCLSPLFNL